MQNFTSKKTVTHSLFDFPIIVSVRFNLKKGFEEHLFRSEFERMFAPAVIKEIKQWDWAHFGLEYDGVIKLHK